MLPIADWRAIVCDSGGIINNVDFYVRCDKIGYKFGLMFKIA